MLLFHKDFNSPIYCQQPAMKALIIYNLQFILSLRPTVAETVEHRETKATPFFF